MSHVTTVFAGIPIPLATKFAPEAALRMSPVSDTLAPSSIASDDDMFAWLAPPSEEFEQSTPPQSPCISIADDPLLFDLDMDSESDPVTPDALFSISDLMDVDGHAMAFHHGVDSDFDVGLANRDSPKEHDNMDATFISDVVSETQDSLASANGDIRTPSTSPRPFIPNMHLTMATPNLSQTLDNITLEQLSPSRTRVDGAVSEKTGRRSPKRSPSRKAHAKPEASVIGIAKNRLTMRRESSDHMPRTPAEMLRGLKAAHRKRARTGLVSEDTSTKDGLGDGRTKTDGVESRGSKIGMRFRRKGSERRIGKGSDDEKNVPVLDQCVKCSTKAKNTPMMRKGPDGCRSLCNACGLKWSRHGIF